MAEICLDCFNKYVMNGEKPLDETVADFGRALTNRKELLNKGQICLAKRIANRLKNITGTITTSDGDVLTRREAQEMREQLLDAVATAVNNRAQAGKSETRYSPIEYDSNGNAYVKIDEDILDGISEEKWFKTVKNVLKEKFRDGIDFNGKRVAVSAKSRGKFTNSDYTRNLTRDDKANKFRMANNLDEVITAQENTKNESPKHPRKDDILSFDRGFVTVETGSRAFDIDVVIANKKDGTQQFYDIVNMVPTKIQHTPQTGRSDASTVDRGSNAVSDPTIPQSNPFVKRFSRDINRAEQNKKDKAEFGLSIGQYAREIMRAIGVPVERTNKRLELALRHAAGLTKEGLITKSTTLSRHICLPNIIYTPISAASIIMFAAVKYSMYCARTDLLSRLTSLNVIRLAMEAMSVPSPPRFTPMISGLKLSVNPESRSAAGTLLISWLDRMPTIHSFPLMILPM